MRIIPDKPSIRQIGDDYLAERVYYIEGRDILGGDQRISSAQVKIDVVIKEPSFELAKAKTDELFRIWAKQLTIVSFD